MSSVYRAARALATKGIPVFPCRRNGKTPLTHRGFYDASTDLSIIGDWERSWPNANLAVPTGLRSGLLVIDLDRRVDRDGFVSLAELETELGTLPVTLKSSTPNHGEHRWFVMPSRPIRSDAGRLRGRGKSTPGIDVRAEGGYVVVAPSVIDNRRYAWQQRAPLAELPDAWIAALTARDSLTADAATLGDPAQRARLVAWCLRGLHREAHELATTPAGGRNDQLWRAAAALGGLVNNGAFGVDDVRRALREACNAWDNRTPSKDESTLERGLAFGLAHPRGVTMRDDSELPTRIEHAAVGSGK